MKTQLLNIKSSEFLKEGGKLYYFTDTEMICVCAIGFPRKEFAIYKGSDIIFRTESILQLVKKVRDYYCFELGFRLESRYTHFPESTALNTLTNKGFGNIHDWLNAKWLHFEINEKYGYISPVVLYKKINNL